MTSRALRLHNDYEWRIVTQLPVAGDAFGELFNALILLGAGEVRASMQPDIPNELNTVMTIMRISWPAGKEVPETVYTEMFDKPAPFATTPAPREAAGGADAWQPHAPARPPHHL